MTIETAIAFSIAMTILAVSPGPGVMASVSQALSGGFRSSLAVITGIITGDLIFVLVAACGMTAVATAMGDMFFMIRLAGGGYLVWLGIRMWTRAPSAFSPITDRPKRGWQRYMGGLFITLGNPKVIIFYAGFLPAFMDLKALSVSGLGILGLLVTVILAAVLGTYAFLAAYAGRFLSSPSASKILHRGAGAMMMGTGVIVATK